MILRYFRIDQTIPPYAYYIPPPPPTFIVYMNTLTEIQATHATFRQLLEKLDKCVDVLQELNHQLLRSTSITFDLVSKILLILNSIPASCIERSQILQTDIPKLAQRLSKLQGYPKLKILGMLRTVCNNFLTAKCGFNRLHTIFLEEAIRHRCYHLTQQVIDHPVVLVEDFGFERLLEFLYYSAVVLTVYERYEEAAERLEMLIRLEKGDSNLKEDAMRKYALIQGLLGTNKGMGKQTGTYADILKKSTNPEFDITPKQRQQLMLDGNLGLLRRLHQKFRLSQLRSHSQSHIRIPQSSLLGGSYSHATTISSINAIQQLYRYDAISKCVEFVRPEVDLEEEISKTVKLYLELRREEKREKRTKWGGMGLGMGGLGRNYGFMTNSYGYS